MIHHWNLSYRSVPAKMLDETIDGHCRMYGTTAIAVANAFSVCDAAGAKSYSCAKTMSQYYYIFRLLLNEIVCTVRLKICLLMPIYILPV